jgi:plasmid stability protein
MRLVRLEAAAPQPGRALRSCRGPLRLSGLQASPPSQLTLRLTYLRQRPGRRSSKTTKDNALQASQSLENGLYAVIAAFDDMETEMATLTVRNLDDEVVRRLRIRAAEHGRSAEAEHRELLRLALVTDEKQRAGRNEAAQRLAEFRHRTAGRGSSPTAALLQEARTGRMEALTGPGEGA